jgi:3-methyl-2-oxobutanoate hydroxymethyltransferase
LVTHDLLGLFNRFTPKFVKKYTNLYDTMMRSFQAYIQEVEEGTFPSSEHSVEMPDEEWEALLSGLAS